MHPVLQILIRNECIHLLKYQTFELILFLHNKNYSFSAAIQGCFSKSTFFDCNMNDDKFDNLPLMADKIRVNSTDKGFAVQSDDEKCVQCSLSCQFLPHKSKTLHFERPMKILCKNVNDRPIIINLIPRFIINNIYLNVSMIFCDGLLTFPQLSLLRPRNFPKIIQEISLISRSRN